MGSVFRHSSSGEHVMCKRGIIVEKMNIFDHHLTRLFQDIVIPSYNHIFVQNTMITNRYPLHEWNK